MALADRNWTKSKLAEKAGYGRMALGGPHGGGVPSYDRYEERRSPRYSRDDEYDDRRY
jgi:hypothetical protein